MNRLNATRTSGEGAVGEGLARLARDEGVSALRTDSPKIYWAAILSYSS
jgi:hypothetical protein